MASPAAPHTASAVAMGDASRERMVLARSVLLIAIGITALLALETWAQALSQPVALGRLFEFGPDEARNYVNGFNRNFNQLLAIVFTTVAIAVPLTANTYSVKFLELFITDRVNLLVLLLFVFGVPNNAWLLHDVKNGYFPGLQASLALGMAVLYPSLLVPYLYYVFRFLHPTTLLRRLSREVEHEAARARRHPASAAQHARAAAELLEHVTSVGARSVERGDRTTAVETVLTLRDGVRAYWRAKAGMPAGWFAADAAIFRSLPPSEVEEIAAARITVEMKVLSELRELLSAAVPRNHDVVSAVAEAVCTLGLDPHARADAALEQVVVEYFNTFIRLAINRRDVRSVFILFHQYRGYAEGIAMERPERVQEIAYYFQYYAQAARDAGMPFVVETIAHDLGALVRSAWERGYPNRAKLLERFLAFDAGQAPLPGVKKAQALLAGYFLLHGQAAEAAQVRDTLRALPASLLASMRDDLLHVRREKFWEINDRRVNMDYVPEAHRARLAELFSDLLDDEPAPAAGSAAAAEA